MKRFQFSLRTLLAVGGILTGAAVGMIVTIARLPNDPAGTYTSPIAGAIVGLLAVLSGFVIRDVWPGSKK